MITLFLILSAYFLILSIIMIIGKIYVHGGISAFFSLLLLLLAIIIDSKTEQFKKCPDPVCFVPLDHKLGDTLVIFRISSDTTWLKYLHPKPKK